MIIVLFLAAAAVPPAMLAEGDARNQAFVTCLFAASREASAGGLSTAEFELMLAPRCQAEGDRLAALMAEVLVLRGMSQATARREARQAVDDARAGVVATYRDR